ncbi:MAG TPA: sigma-54 dependent transcriptional regulator [Melioribacteraceae bacterium]|nr:sigma-54 dependent transcriptional regulator [Melioribacteraceae bacterium]
MSKVLIIDDNEDVLLAGRLLLKQQADVVITEKNPENILSLVSSQIYDVIFLDMNFTKDMTSGNEGFFWLKEILKVDPLAVVILITAYGDVEMAVKAMKEGATDFVLKPWQNEKFLATFFSALKLRESRIELEKVKNKQEFILSSCENSFGDIIGTSTSMKKVFNTINKVAETDANVLILGENGTGKELVARSLYKKSNRRKEVFISVDMGAITHSLFESELFGHTKGAFTDAKEDRPGRFEVASGGTLFLDEIGNIPIELQVKLLTAIQKHQITRIGSNKIINIDIRLICATNMPIYDLVNTNKFRQDLLYRINTVEINLPPLREREEDILLLAEHFLTSFKKKYNKPNLIFDRSTFKQFESYNWPGNVRELQHSIERAVILCDNNKLMPSDFFFNKANSKKDNLVDDNFNLEEIERNIIQKAMAKYQGNITKVAKELGLTRTSLYRRMEKYNL